MKKDYLITATCTFGLERVLKTEILKLGYEIAESSEGAVKIYGDITDVYRLNIWLRTSNRVLIQLGEGKAESFDELFELVKSIDWASYLPSDAKCNVSKITCVKSKLFSKSDCQRIIKKALSERLSKSYGFTRLPETGAEYPLFVTIKNDHVQLNLNTSGESLHRRGYRLAKGEAPLKETLAAGIILLSYYHGQCEFADIMCGSGTIIIEAALIAANRPPGINRQFAFEKWDLLTEKDQNNVKMEIESRTFQIKHRILGSDIDGSVLKNARENAERAGVSDDVSIQKLDFREFKSKKYNGLIVTNPPYAERIGEFKKTEKLYKDMSVLVESLNNWDISVLCGYSEFQRAFGRKADKNRKLFNGDMLTYLYQYQGMKKI